MCLEEVAGPIVQTILVFVFSTCMSHAIGIEYSRANQCSGDAHFHACAFPRFSNGYVAAWIVVDGMILAINRNFHG